MSIVSKTDNIPAKKIVKALGTIIIRISEMWSFTGWNEAEVMESYCKKQSK